MESGGRGGERRLALDDLENVERLDGRELARIVEKNLAAVHDDEMRESGFLEESKGREREAYHASDLFFQVAHCGVDIEFHHFLQSSTLLNSTSSIGISSSGFSKGTDSDSSSETSSLFSVSEVAASSFWICSSISWFFNTSFSA